jgi:hypothetical protein
MLNKGCLRPGRRPKSGDHVIDLDIVQAFTGYGKVHVLLAVFVRKSGLLFADIRATRGLPRRHPLLGVLHICRSFRSFCIKPHSGETTPRASDYYVPTSSMEEHNPVSGLLRRCTLWRAVSGFSTCSDLRRQRHSTSVGRIGHG